MQEFQEEQQKLQIKFINQKNKEKKNKKPKNKKESNIKEDIILYANEKPNNLNESQKVSKSQNSFLQRGLYINNFDSKNNSTISSTKEVNYENQMVSSESSAASNRSNMSIERSIIKSGLKNFTERAQNDSGPFNFRLLLKPTILPPTESLRKRKLIFTSSPHIPDKNIKF